MRLLCQQVDQWNKMSRLIQLAQEINASEDYSIKSQILYIHPYLRWHINTMENDVLLNQTAHE